MLCVGIFAAPILEAELEKRKVPVHRIGRVLPDQGLRVRVVA